MTSMIEGAADRNQDVVNRLHGIIRPFVLRRLKKDVETQMPGKFEHILKCHLSRRQVSAFLVHVIHCIRRCLNFMYVLVDAYL
jgi:SNF2 family DNA or RNA helicase